MFVRVFLLSISLNKDLLKGSLIIIDWLISHSYLVSGPKSSWSKVRHFCIAARASSSSTFKHFSVLTRYLMRAPQHYLTLAEFGRCPKLSHRNEWHSLDELGIRVVLISCTWLLSIQTTQLSPSYTTKGKLCEHVVSEKFKFPLRDLNSNSHLPQLNVLPLSYDAPCLIIIKTCGGVPMFFLSLLCTPFIIWQHIQLDWLKSGHSMILE